MSAGLSVDSIAGRTGLTGVEVRRAIAKLPCGCGRPGNHMGRCYSRREAQAVEQEAGPAVATTATPAPLREAKPPAATSGPTDDLVARVAALEEIVCVLLTSERERMAAESTRILSVLPQIDRAIGHLGRVLVRAA